MNTVEDEMLDKIFAHQIAEHITDPRHIQAFEARIYDVSFVQLAQEVGVVPTTIHNRIGTAQRRIRNLIKDRKLVPHEPWEKLQQLRRAQERKIMYDHYVKQTALRLKRKQEHAERKAVEMAACKARYQRELDFENAISKCVVRIRK